ncbi:hypothetical protein DY467_13270 [Rhodopseudomonas sp. BR0G17]|nr:hypothetical protein [Rhodopseudomonas sp. BR0G17]
MHCVLILRSPAKPGVSKDGATRSLRPMVRDGASRLLTMRGVVAATSPTASLILRRTEPI